MSSLAGRTIATIGSGVMAESIIAGLLRGNLVESERLVASHPRADRREALSQAHGIRALASNAEAVRGADIVLLAIKPQMLGRVGRELRGELRPVSSSSASWRARRPRRSSATSGTTRSSGRCRTRPPSSVVA